MLGDFTFINTFIKDAVLRLMLELHLVYAYERYLADYDPTPLDGGDDYVPAMSFEDFKEEYYDAN